MFVSPKNMSPHVLGRTMKPKEGEIMRMWQRRTMSRKGYIRNGKDQGTAEEKRARETLLA